MEESKRQDIVPKSIVDLLVNDAFRRNGADIDEKREITDQQKEEIKQLVKDLEKQVDSFLK